MFCNRKVDIAFWKIVLVVLSGNKKKGNVLIFQPRFLHLEERCQDLNILYLQYGVAPLFLLDPVVVLTFIKRLAEVWVMETSLYGKNLAEGQSDGNVSP